MKSVKIGIIPAGLLVAVIVLSMSFFQKAVQAESSRPESSSQRPMKMKKPEAAPVKPCPDLKVKLKVLKGGTGLVTLNGTITNVGGADYDLPSEAQYFMNLSYPPKTYAQVGVSEQLCTKSFSQLKKGAAMDVNCTYQIPNFGEWIDEMEVGNAARLFTLRVVKKDMTPFASGEECNDKNNSKGVEVKYAEKK